MDKDIVFPKAIEDIKRLKGRFRNWFVAGFVDGEGSFNVSFARQPTRPGGFLITPRFQVYQHKDYEGILWVIKDVINCGRIDKKWGTDVRVLTVENRKTLQEKILPFSQRYFPITKRKALVTFAKILGVMERREHLTLSGFLKIIDLAYDMNQNGKARKIPKAILIKEVKHNFNQPKNPQRPNAKHYNY